MFLLHAGGVEKLAVTPKHQTWWQVVASGCRWLQVVVGGCSFVRHRMVAVMSSPKHGYHSYTAWTQCIDGARRKTPQQPAISKNPHIAWIPERFRGFT